MSLSALERGTGARTPLERCTGDADSFLEHAWGCRASIHMGADSAAFGDLLTIDDVDRFLTTTALRTPYFRLVAAGRRIDESAYTRSGRTGSRDVHGMADPARVAALFEGGATLVLQGLHRWSEPVTRFCRDLELELGHPSQVNAYITPATAQGLERHADPHDVFVLQAFGRKRWELGAAPGEERRDPFEVEVGPGDAIYLPAGTPHAASAQEVVSGHLTVGVHVTTWLDVLADVWADLAKDGAMEGHLPAGWTGALEAVATELSSRLGRISAVMRDSVDVRAVLEKRRERFLSSRAQLARGTIAERATPVKVDDQTLLRRRPGAICELLVRGDTLVALLGDRRLEMPAWLAPAMRRAAASEELLVGDLARHLPEAQSRAVLARRLVREGLFSARGAG